MGACWGCLRFEQPKRSTIDNCPQLYCPILPFLLECRPRIWNLRYAPRQPTQIDHGAESACTIRAERSRCSTPGSSIQRQDLQTSITRLRAFLHTPDKANNEATAAHNDVAAETQASGHTAVRSMLQSRLQRLKSSPSMQKLCASYETLTRDTRPREAMKE